MYRYIDIDMEVYIYVYTHTHREIYLPLNLLCEHLCNYMVSLNVVSSVQFSHSVVSDSLRPHRLQHRRRQWPPTPVLLPGKSHGWRSLVDCSPWGREESDTTERLHFDFYLSCIGEGNGNPFQCSCLENPRDGGAWWAAVYESHRVGHDWSDLAAAADCSTPGFRVHHQLPELAQTQVHWVSNAEYPKSPLY